VVNDEDWGGASNSAGSLSAAKASGSISKGNLEGGHHDAQQGENGPDDLTSLLYTRIV
jgi:hypothetical protein